jgi:outer membrane receptor protein involved in Fe transport
MIPRSLQTNFPCCRYPDLADVGWVSRRLWALAIAAATVFSAAEGQEAREPVFELSPFQVDTSSDVGYLSTNAVSGTSLNTAIRDLPMTIQVINAEFIKDIGATDLDEALAFTSGVFTSNLEASSSGASAAANRAGGSAERSASAGARGDRFSNTVEIRGFNVNFQNRDGFRVGGLVITRDTNIALGGLLDTSNIERLEVVKGPNSLLYGIGVISGIVNVIPKMPLSEPRLNLEIKAGSFGFMRTTAEATGPLIGRGDQYSLNYRVVGAHEERGDWTDYYGKELNYAAFQLDFHYGRNANIFLELQTNKTRYEGIGPKFVYDDLSGALYAEFRNPYDEQYNFSQDGRIPGLTPVALSQTPGTGESRDYDFLMSEPDEGKRALQAGTLPDSYRVSGPDTYDERKEWNLLLKGDFTLAENLTLSLGAYYTATEQREFTVNIKGFSSEEGTFLIRQSMPLKYSDLSKREYSHLMYSLSNPAASSVASGQVDFDLTKVNSVDDIKLVRYWWSLRPEETESFQWRARVNYDFETRFFGGTSARHNLLVGFQYINDKVDFLDGEEGIDRAFINAQTDARVLSGQMSVETALEGLQDGLYFRSIADNSVLRYNGENLVTPGTLFRHQDIWYAGLYGIYSLKLFQDTVEILGGGRLDRYNATTATYERLSPEEQSLWRGVRGPEADLESIETNQYIQNPYSIIYGVRDSSENFPEAIEEFSLMLGLNYDLTESLTVYALYSEGISPNTALTDGNNDTIDAERTVSKEVGIKFGLLDDRLSGSMALFEIERENAIWDYREAPAPSKWYGSPNPPLNFSPGDSSFNPAQADSSALMYGIDSVHIGSEINRLFATGQVRKLGGEWVYRDPVTQTFIPFGGLVDLENANASPEQRLNRRTIWYIDYDQLDIEQSFNIYKADPNGELASPNGTRYTIVETVTPNWRQYLENAFNDRQNSGSIPGSFYPFFYNRNATGQLGNNPSASGSSAGGDTFVTFNDRSVGVDMELVYSATRSLQFILNYSHVERTAVGGFEMLDYIDLSSGLEYAGTEYSAIAKRFGREAFGITSMDTNNDGVPDQFFDSSGERISRDNPFKPSDAISGIDGVSLHFNPEDTLTLATKYSFLDGLFDGTAVFVGVKFEGEAQTSIPIGGSDLADNLFRTPDAGSRLTIDLGLFYSFQYKSTRWRLSLNIQNLTDDRETFSSVVTANPFYNPSQPVSSLNRADVTKRSRILHVPRTFRVGVDISF